MLRSSPSRARIRPPGFGGARRSSWLGAVLVAVLVTPLRASADPVELNDVRQNLFATCMVSDTAGWMVGELGRIFHTTDGGKTWERQQAATKRPFLAISCLDAQNVWIAGTVGMMFHTTDGGKTWSEVKTGGDRHIFTLQFATPERGHAAGDFGAMVHTEDGGKTWTKQQVPTDTQLPETAVDTGVDPGDVNVYSLSYGDPDHAWLVGEFGVILTSSDGARTWRQQKSPVETTLFGVKFIDARRGWAVGSDGIILRTTDAGETWMPQRSSIVARPLYDVFVRDNNGWIVGEAGAMLKSTDGGATWTAEQLPIQLAARWIRSIFVSPGLKGFAVGAEGLVFRLDGATAERLARRDGEGQS